MTRFIVRRIGLAALAVWGVVTIVFLMSKAIPGDAARVAAGRFATPAQVEHMRQVLGLNQSILVQYLSYLGRVLRGDLGTSIVTHAPVSADLAAVLPTTVELMLLGMLITVVVAVPLGIVAAVKEGKAGDIAARIILIFAGGVPVFWLAIMMRWTFGLLLGWFPISGTSSIGMAPPNVTGFTILDAVLFGNIGNVVDAVRHLILPAVALSAPFISNLARIVRSDMMTALKSDYVTFAVSKGVRPRRIILRHAFRSAMGSSLTVFGMQFGWMISSAVLVEAVFALPGIGSYLYQAIINSDTFSVLAAVTVIALVFIVSSLVVDIVQMLIDPRVRRAEAMQ